MENYLIRLLHNNDRRKGVLPRLKLLIQCFKGKVKVKATQSFLTLLDPMVYTVWNSPGQNIGVGSLSLLQGIFPIQGSNPGLPHCRQILYQLIYKGRNKLSKKLPSNKIPKCSIKPMSCNDLEKKRSSLEQPLGFNT